MLEIQRGDTLGANIKELKDFYLIHLLPKIIEGEILLYEFLSAFTQHRVALPFEMLALLFIHIIVGLVVLIFD